MVASNFDSFDASGFDAFIESPLGARNPGTGDRFLVWPWNEPRTFTRNLARDVIEQIGPDWHTQEDWTGCVQDYGHITCDGYNYSVWPWTTEFWEDVERPSWYDAVMNGEWTGRIHLGAVAAFDARPDTTPAEPTLPEFAAVVNGFLAPLIESFDQSITGAVAIKAASPFNGQVPVPDQPLTEGVSLVGFHNQMHGTAVIGGDGESLADIGEQSLARVVVKEWPNGNKVSAVITGDLLGLPADSGLNPPRWDESSRQLARNFWNVPI